MSELISREQLLKYVGAEDIYTPDEMWKPAREWVEIIEAMPTIESKPKGKWLVKTDRLWVVCSNCCNAVGGLGWSYPYCPYCAAEMEGMERDE